jgi:hypothetical protein
MLGADLLSVALEGMHRTAIKRKSTTFSARE